MSTLPSGETAKGGNSTVTLTPDMLPQHSHSATATDSGHGHTFTGSSHTHDMYYTNRHKRAQETNIDSGTEVMNTSMNTMQGGEYDEPNMTGRSTKAGSKFMSSTSTSGTVGSGKANISVTVGNMSSGGKASAINIEPEFYILAYIMKVS
jgi:microcystin-dependent protein